MNHQETVRKSLVAASRGRAAAAAAALALLAACSANVVAPSVGTGAGGTSATGGTSGGTSGGGAGGLVFDGGPRPESGPTEDANCGLQNLRAGSPARDRRPAPGSLDVDAQHA